MPTTPSGIGGSLGDAEAAALLAGEDLLSKDTIPNENQQIRCFSCEKQMVGLFCHACGQKNDDYRRSIWSLISETFASLFSLESRIWRTWLTLLLKPGKVSREFSDGRRTVWTSPVRIYLAMSIVLFGYMSITETRIFSVRTDIVPKQGIVGDIAQLDDHSVTLSPDIGFFRRQAEIDVLNKNVDFNRVARIMDGTVKQAFNFGEGLTSLNLSLDEETLKSIGVWPDPDDDTAIVDTISAKARALETYSERLEDLIDEYNDLITQTIDPETIIDRILSAKEDGVPLDLLTQLNPNLDDSKKSEMQLALVEIDTELAKLGLSRDEIHTLPKETGKNYFLNIDGNVTGLFLSQSDVRDFAVNALKNPALLNDGISRYLPRIMFLMMPLAALIGLTFIRGRRNALLYDHIVHAAYIHAVAFGYLLILILLTQWTPLKGSMNIFLIGMMIYLPLSTKNMFKRDWFKTIFASYTIASIYSLVMFIVVMLLTAQSVKNTVLISQL